MSKHVCTMLMSFLSLLPLTASGAEALPRRVQRAMTPRLAALLQAAQELEQRMREAISILEAARSREAADAAVAAIHHVREAEERFRELSRECAPDAATTEQLYAQGSLHYILRRLPAALYNKALQQQIAHCCHGSTRLFAAIAEREDEFTDEELDTPLSPEESATLRTVEQEVLGKLQDLDAAGVANFTEAILATAQAVEKLEQSAAGAMHWQALVQQHRSSLISQYKRGFMGYGPVIELGMRRADNYFARMYSREARERFLLNYGVGDVSDASVRMREQLWVQAQQRMPELRHKHRLRGGDGSSAQQAVQLPDSVTLETLPEVAETLVRDLFGAEHVVPSAYNKERFAAAAKESTALQVPVFVAYRPCRENGMYDPPVFTHLYLTLPHHP